MPTCFIIQPFDGGKFDKRYEDTFRPAVLEAGLEPYRVDRDPQVEVPIEAIDDGIRGAAICLADITTDNPNVWYELGYAFAAGKQVVMLCSAERQDRRYPFDIQHRSVIEYPVESASDFEQLKERIRERLEALLKKGERLRQVAQSDQIAPREGMSQPELAVLAVVAGDAAISGEGVSTYSLKHDIERAGFTAVGFALGVRRLLAKRLIEEVELHNERGEEYPGLRPTEAGWNWIDQNDELFSLVKSPNQRDDFGDDIPF